MFNHSQLLPDGITWLLLAISVLSIFIRPKYWPYLLTATLLSALWLDRITLTAALISGTGLGLAVLSQKTAGKWLLLLHGAILMWASALALHLVTGFHNLPVLDNVISGPGSVPFSMRLNLDKPLIIFALYSLVPDMLGHPRSISTRKYLILATAFIALPAMALGLGLVAPEFSVPDWLWIFVLNNLLFTCVAEEVLFRGYIQQILNRYFSHWVAIGIASALFGLAHFSGGAAFILLAAYAGALYGVTYYWTGRLSMAIAIHFAFNLIHLLFFTYPLASPVSQ